MPGDASFDPLIRKLGARFALDESDRAALRGLPHALRTLEPSAYIVREGDQSGHCSIILSGFASRHKLTGGGARQIVALHMPGKLLDAQNGFLRVADHNVQALTRVEIAFVSRPAVEALTASNPNIAHALWIDALVDAAVAREWVVNVGRRDATTRIAHLMCEFALRVEVAGLDGEYGHALPMTQEQIADAVGLTAVHVNRVLRELERRGLIERTRRSFAIPDWRDLREIGDFNARYLHLDQANGDDFIPH